ncbi:MAG: GNAT family N-acetyltransferase [Lutibacter sp.]|nr:MAG: GNAT family N-acetyltransferase [Lutibacter sp.]
MNQIRLKNTSDTFFSDAWELYQEAFPKEERKLLDAQTRVMSNPLYHYDVVIVDNQLIGFLLWWDLDSVRYIDHFATVKEQRNKGYGKSILENFMSLNDKPVLLEVELPESSINRRRIKFYERIGFKLNKHHYELPVFNEGEPPLQLLLMTYPRSISKDEVEQFVRTCHPIVFSE